MIPERGERLLPAVSALLAVSAFPPFHLIIPSFVALVPLAIWVADQEASDRDWSHMVSQPPPIEWAGRFDDAPAAPRPPPLIPFHDFLVNSRN